MTEANYVLQSQALLPQGPAWTRDKNAIMTKLLSVFGSIFYAVDKRAVALVNEANPMNSLELLSDWERICGLPDECAKCVDTPKTIEERRNDVINLLTSNSWPTAAYFRSIAERMGYEIIVRDLVPFICGLNRCGDSLNGAPTVRYDVFTIMVKGERLARFKVGTARCGDLLGAIRYATELECVLNKLKPAHVIFIYSYEEGES